MQNANKKYQETQCGMNMLTIIFFKLQIYR